jgi:hypothetical protein
MSSHDAWDDREEPLAPGLERLSWSALQRPPVPAGVRDLIWESTRAVVRRRRWTRRARFAALLGATFVAGFAAGRARSGEAQAATGMREATAEVVAPAAGGRPSPADVEARAQSAPPEARAPAMREAGDLFLASGDLEGALRCYHRALERRPRDNPGAAGERGTWLYLALQSTRE